MWLPHTTLSIHPVQQPDGEPWKSQPAGDPLRAGAKPPAVTDRRGELEGAWAGRTPWRSGSEGTQKRLRSRRLRVAPAAGQADEASLPCTASLRPSPVLSFIPVPSPSPLAAVSFKSTTTAMFPFWLIYRFHIQVKLYSFYLLLSDLFHLVV